jgi:hypothetical protein
VTGRGDLLGRRWGRRCRLVLAAYVGAETEPSYFILLDWESGGVKMIRDLRYVPYIASEAVVAPA